VKESTIIGNFNQIKRDISALAQMIQHNKNESINIMNQLTIANEVNKSIMVDKGLLTQEEPHEAIKNKVEEIQNQMKENDAQQIPIVESQNEKS